MPVVVDVIRTSQSVVTSGSCSLDGGITYTLLLEDSMGMKVEEKTVSSDNCTNSSCSTSFFPSQPICVVQIVASNIFGSSEMTLNIRM